ncbi:hypothetical protein DDZ15_09565 [Rhodohalobacter mucosus]|uniref:DUF2971 domain-containing protein n=2 Tax=Rhodohalobacter mucosus TaxID=2079485 RepID=A0A316TUS8_9BACT|nr:hypothetical protein DDZ15_09565 [Rhodohalobacter mucosus]
MPSLLYKYRVFDEDNFGIKMATTGEAFFSSARHLNDPFEHYFIPESNFIGLPEDELKQYIHKKTKQRFSTATRLQRKELESIAWKRAMIHRKDPTIAAAELLELQYERFGILSLVRDWNSLPMWAYYSENHEGICIGLKTEVIAEKQKQLLTEEGILLALHDVIYTDEIPHVNIDTPLNGDSTDENFDVTEAVHCTKSIHWKHENEIRLIMWNHPDTPYSFGADAVGEVIIGLNAKDENIEKLKKELSRVDSNAVIKRAIKSKEKYGLTFEDIEL